MEIFLNPDDYILRQVVTYPSLYSDHTFDGVRIRVLDQVLNVIGNGIRNHEELLSNLRYSNFDRDLALRFCSGERPYYGFQDVEMIGNYAMGKGEPIIVVNSDRCKYPEIKHWSECGQFEWDPYPNFQKTYSTVWKTNFEELGPAWAESATWFYERCREWFEHNESKYHYAFPKHTPGLTQQFLTDMKTQRSRYSSDEEFSQAYEFPYNGNMEEFLTARWKAELEKIHTFIDETIDKLSR